MLNTRRTKLITTVTLLILMIFIGVQAYAELNIVAINAPNIRQSKTNWCWAASSASLLQSKGVSVTQNSFSKAVKGNDTNNSTATANEVVSGINSFGYRASKTGATNVGVVRDNLSSKRGIIAGYIYRTGGGHMVVISGHDNEVDTLEVMDPGVGRKVYYKDSYFRSNSSWDWYESVY